MTGFFRTAVVLAIAVLCAGCSGPVKGRAGLQLTLTSWAPVVEPKAVLVAVHGRNNDHEAFVGAASVWAQRGILTYAYDQRLLMAEDGPRGVSALATDLEAVVNQVHASNPNLPLYLVGESMGASVILMTMAQPKPYPISGVILASPAIWPDGATAAVTEEILTTAADLFGSEALHSWAALIALMDEAPRRAPLLPTKHVLVLYGENDPVIPEAGIDRLMFELGTTAELRRFPGFGHRLFLAGPGSAVVADWIAKASPEATIAKVD